jgi:uncharacterized membrane-anchored protein
VVHKTATSILVTLICAIVLATPTRSLAQSPAAPQGEAAQRAELEAAWQAGVKAGARGPAGIKLIDQATLNLSADYLFIPKTEAARIMRALGNTVNEKAFVGLVIGTRRDDQWIVDTEFINDGYIKDDEAKNWNADELLQGLKDGTVEANKDRAARGFPELEVLGWVEKPAYDSTTHRLVWSLLAKEKGQPDSAEKDVNYNTYALGRDGYFSLNLLTDSTRIAGTSERRVSSWRRCPTTPARATTISTRRPTASRPTASPHWSAASQRRSSACWR